MGLPPEPELNWNALVDIDKQLEEACAKDLTNRTQRRLTARQKLEDVEFRLRLQTQHFQKACATIRQQNSFIGALAEIPAVKEEFIRRGWLRG